MGTQLALVLFSSYHSSIEMITAVIIDDEKSGRLLLGDLLTTYAPQVKVVADAGSVEAGVAAINELSPELVFLDVEMPRGSGFDVLEGVHQRDFEVIFITAYDQYAVNAFKVAAVDYLLKPINIEQLKQAVEKASDQRKMKKQDERFQFLLDKIGNKPNSNGRLILPTLDGFQVIKLHEIIRTESEANYTRFYSGDGKSFLVSRTMREYEELLTEFGFFRIHRSHLINLDHVKRYIRGRGGEVEMTDGTMLSVARDRKDEFLEAMM